MGGGMDPRMAQMGMMGAQMMQQQPEGMRAGDLLSDPRFMQALMMPGPGGGLLGLGQGQPMQQPMGGQLGMGQPMGPGGLLGGRV